MTIIDNNPEPYEPMIFHANKKYFFRKELGRGTQGIVYLYEEEEDSSKKLAVKAGRLAEQKTTFRAFTTESFSHKKIFAHVGLKKYVPAHFGDAYFEPRIPVIKSEYIN